MQVKQLYHGGPFRRINPNNDGSYVCAECKKDTHSVHFTANGWLCAECLNNPATVKPSAGISILTVPAEGGA